MLLYERRKDFFPLRSRCSLRVGVSSVKLQMRFKGENLPLELHFRDVTVNLHRFATSGTVHTHTLAGAPGSAKCFFDTASISKEKSWSRFCMVLQIKQARVRTPFVGIIIIIIIMVSTCLIAGRFSVVLKVLESQWLWCPLVKCFSLGGFSVPQGLTDAARPCLFWVISHSSLCAFDRWFRAQ